MEYYCIDSGSPYCPCHLAEINSCLICSLLQGQETCDCKWHGLCIYHEFLWIGKKVNTLRQDIKARIVEKSKLTEKLLLLKIQVPAVKLINQYNQPGAFIFMRPAGTSRFFDMPLCVMDADENTGILTFAIHVRGPKTKAIKNTQDEVIIRGPYFNGVFGLKHIKSSIDNNWLIVARGIGQASLMPIIRNLLRAKNNITVILDPGTLGVNPVEQYLRETRVNLEILSFTQSLEETVKKHLSQPFNVDFVFSAGPDKQHERLWEILNKYGYQKPFIMSNNYSMCCGEGVCGSCITKINGKRMRLCKMQMESQNVLGG